MKLERSLRKTRSDGSQHDGEKTAELSSKKCGSQNFIYKRTSSQMRKPPKAVVYRGTNKALEAL